LGAVAVPRPWAPVDLLTTLPCRVWGQCGLWPALATVTNLTIQDPHNISVLHRSSSAHRPRPRPPHKVAHITVAHPPACTSHTSTTRRDRTDSSTMGISNLSTSSKARVHNAQRSAGAPRRCLSSATLKVRLPNSFRPGLRLAVGKASARRRRLRSSRFAHHGCCI